jgi:hypothetical protein
MQPRFSRAFAEAGVDNVSQLTVKQYDSIEDAITHGRRISIWRRGTEYVIVPLALRSVNRRECIDTRHPATGARLTIWLDEVDAVEEVR